MPSDFTQRQHIITLFDQKPCWMIEPLASQLGYSVPSIRRFLSKIGYYSSFTHNGKWYTLRSIPQFNRDGLCFFKKIGFSRSGSLTGTIINLTVRSPAGMTAEQLSGKLRCRCHSILVKLYRHGKLERRKVGRSYVYFAVDPPIQTMQQETIANRNRSMEQLPAEIAVFVLAEFIRQPDLSFEQLANVVARRHFVTLAATHIEKLFALHDLKKTMPTTEPKP